MITDEMLSLAAAELADAMNDSLPNPDECNHQFSASFEKKMKRLVRRSNHPVLYRILRSVACIIFVFMIGFGSILTINAEARAFVFGWVKQQYESFYEYFFEGEKERSTSETPKYYPDWMPDECESVTHYDTAGGEVYIYTDKQETLIQFSYTSNPDSENIFIDGVNYKNESVLINGCYGELYLSQDETETNSIVWMDETETVLFIVSGDYEPDTLVKIAENIVEK